MQQKNATNPVHNKLIRHDVSHTPSTSLWVVDSQRLVPGKQNEAIAHKGCDSGCGAPAVLKKN